MPSFDIVSEVDMHELSNALDQANREVSTRYDFKGSDANFEHTETHITLHAENEFQIQQMLDVLYGKLSKRGIDIQSLDVGDVEENNRRARLAIQVKQGIETAIGKKIVKLIKDKKMKVQPSIQGEQVRVSGKKRDDLQTVMAMLREEDLGLPLQFNNFRD